MKIKFTAPIEPVPFPRPASNGKRRFNPPRYTEFKNALGLFARRAMNGQPPISGAVKICVDLYRRRNPTSRNFGDADNHLKSILDALNGICYGDDAQVVCGTFTKNRGDPLIVIELEELP